MSASEFSGQVPGAAEADAHLIGLARLEGAERLFSDAALSQAVGRPVTATHLRLKPGQSVTVAWQSAGAGSDGAGPAEHGWAQVTADSDKIRKTLSRAEKAHCPDQVTVHELPGSVLLIGSVWTDPKLAVELHRAHRRQAQARGTDEPWQVLRYNPGRRLVARSGPDVLRVHTAPLDGPTGMVQTVRRWRSWDLPVLPLRSLGGHGTAAASPFWGSGDALELPHQDTARAAGELIGRLHSRRASRSPLPAAPLRVRSAAESLAESAPWLAEAARALATRLEPLLLQDLSDSPAVELHGDLSPDQLLVAEPGSTDVKLIDVDRAGTGPAARDVGSWLATCRRHRLPELNQGFLAGYSAHAPSPSAALAAWESYAHLLAALDPLRHREPDWPAQVTERLLWAQDALDRGVTTRGTAAPEPATAGGEVTAQLPAAVVQADGADWTVQRVWPGKESGTLTVEVRGQEVLRAGLWRRQGLELFPAGQDRKLPALAPLVQAGAQVVSHRAHRRAVVRHHRPDDGTVTFTKIVRPGRAEAILCGIDRAQPFERGFRTPAVLEGGDSTVSFAELPGRSLHEPELFSAQEWERAWAEVMESLQVSRATDPGVDVPEHTVGDEARVLREWVDRAAPWIRDLEPLRTQVEQACAALEQLSPVDAVPTHRDLHDKQLVWSAEHALGPGLLDVDTACLGHPALDLGNLRAHARWRRRQGVWTAAQAETVVRAVDGLAERTGLEPAALELFERATLLRIRCVYAFRPAYVRAAEELQSELFGGAEARP